MLVGNCQRAVALFLQNHVAGSDKSMYVVAFVQECVDEGRTDMAALHAVPIDRRHTEEHAEDGIARTVGTAEMVVVPLIVHGKLPGHGHRFLGQRAADLLMMGQRPRQTEHQEHGEVDQRSMRQTRGDNHALPGLYFLAVSASHRPSTLLYSSNICSATRLPSKRRTYSLPH